MSVRTTSRPIGLARIATRRSLRRAATWAALALALLGAACGGPKADVTRDELVDVIERDGVVFTDGTIPRHVVERLAANRVVVLGETHHLREHWAFTAALMRGLHPRGHRQLLLELPHMADWLVDDYVAGGVLEPGFALSPFYARRLSAIRDLNDTLPAADRVHVRAIDVNEEHYGGASAFRDLLGALTRHFPSAGPVAEFLRADYATRAAQTRAVDSLRAALHAGRSQLTASWGRRRFDHVVEMVEVERASIDIRADREHDDERAARAREDVIKELAEARVAGSPHGTVVNIGGNHAQKARLKGTKTEWLGDYLVHRSTAVDGSAITVAVVSAKTVLEPGATGTPVDVRKTSPENELFRVMAETRPGRTVFLPLDDPLFTDGAAAVSFEETVYVAALKEHYDAVLQYGLAHRMPID